MLGHIKADMGPLIPDRVQRSDAEGGGVDRAVDAARNKLSNLPSNAVDRRYEAVATQIAQPLRVFTVRGRDHAQAAQYRQLNGKVAHGAGGASHEQTRTVRKIQGIECLQSGRSGQWQSRSQVGVEVVG